MKQFSVCVFCGASQGTNPAHMRAANDVGTLLAHNQMRLVYGAGDVGLMGAVARACKLAGGTTFGVIPEHLVKWEVGKTDLTSYIVTETMQERKKIMFMNCDAVVLLPGGAGSLDEIFEILTWRQLGLHTKPVFILNIDDYWSPLLKLFDHIIAEGFAQDTLQDYFTVLPDTNALDAALKAL